MAPKHHPLFNYKIQYKKIKKILNDKAYLSKQYKYNIPSKNQLKFHKHHPLNIGHKLLNTIEHPLKYAPNQLPQIQQPFKALPLYDIPKPEILNINHKEINKNPKKYKYWTIVYCDGSSAKNPGKGAGAWMILQSPTHTGTSPIVKTFSHISLGLHAFICALNARFEFHVNPQ